MIDPLNTVFIQRAIQEQLEKAYIDDGRADPGHPFHSFYTGLFCSGKAELPPTKSVDNGEEEPALNCDRKD